MDETRDAGLAPAPTSQGEGSLTGAPPPLRHADLPDECRNCLLAVTREPLARECRVRLAELFRNDN